MGLTPCNRPRFETAIRDQTVVLHFAVTLSCIKRRPRFRALYVASFFDIDAIFFCGKKTNRFRFPAHADWNHYEAVTRGGAFLNLRALSFVRRPGSPSERSPLELHPVPLLQVPCLDADAAIELC